MRASKPARTIYSVTSRRGGLFLAPGAKVSVPDEEKSAVRFSIMHKLERIEQEGLVLCGLEAADMADDELIRHLKLRAVLLAHALRPVSYTHLTLPTNSRV